MKTNRKYKTSLVALLLSAVLTVSCSDDTPEVYISPSASDESEVTTEEETVTTVNNLSALHVDGRYLKDASGAVVNLHGFAQTFSPYFNESAWTNYDVDKCLSYNKEKIDQILAAGWQMTFVRQHMDPYWCAPGSGSENQTHLYFNFDDFKTYLDKVYIPMAEYAISKGLYVVMRPPGVCPETIAVGDEYEDYLLEVWDYVSSHSKIKNNPGIMFELANEPVHIKGTDGSVGGNTDPQFEALAQFLQPVVDVIRGNGAENVIWLPGLGYQSWYSGFTKYPVTGDNLGMAVHCYPGWYGSDALSDSGEGLYDGTNGGYASFQKGWDNQMGSTPDSYPLMVTEMDWSNGNVYYTQNSDGSTSNLTWGQGVTGTAGGSGFGANFRYITDNSGNVSYIIFTSQEYLAAFVDMKPAGGVYTFFTDPENSCIWPAYHWYQEYAGVPNTALAGDIVSLEAYVDGTTYADGESLSLARGATARMVVYGVYSGGDSEVLSTASGYTVSIDDWNVLSVDNLVNLSALAPGTTTVTVEYSGLKMSLSVTVAG